MSEQFATAIAEYEQDLGIRPGTLCAYDVTVGQVVDLCDTETRSATGVEPDDLRCPWKKYAFIDKTRPPTWDIARRLFDAGASGIRVPSVQAVGGINLVLWRWNDIPDRAVAALDPLGDLPKQLVAGFSGRQICLKVAVKLDFQPLSPDRVTSDFSEGWNG